MNMREYKQADIYFTEALKNVDPNSPYYQNLLYDRSAVIQMLKMKELQAEEDRGNK